MLENLKPYTQGEQATLVALNKKIDLYCHAKDVVKTH